MYVFGSIARYIQVDFLRQQSISSDVQIITVYCHLFDQKGDS